MRLVFKNLLSHSELPRLRSVYCFSWVIELGNYVAQSHPGFSHSFEHHVGRPNSRRGMKANPCSLTARTPPRLAPGYVLRRRRLTPLLAPRLMLIWATLAPEGGCVWGGGGCFRSGPCGCYAVRASHSPNPTPTARANPWEFGI